MHQNRPYKLYDPSCYFLQGYMSEIIKEDLNELALIVHGQMDVCI